MIQTRIAIHRETRCYKTTRIQPTITVLRTSVSARVCTSFDQFLIAILILVLNSDDLNTSGSSNNPNSKLGMHIKSEDPATDPLAGVDGSNFGGPNSSGPNRPNMSPDRIQPLPSNVVNKQSNSMDVSINDQFLRDQVITGYLIAVHAAAKSNFCLLHELGQQKR